MSKIERFQGDVKAFASNAQGLERTVFGGTTQANDLTSQVTAAFLRGWGIVGPSEHPSLEDFNAAMFAMSQFIAYQHQIGTPEWHTEQEYYTGSVCTHGGVSYQSLIDDNVGNEPPSAQWTPVLTAKSGGEAFQPKNGNLTALAALVGSANKLPYFTGAGAMANTDLTTAGRELISKADVDGILTYLGLADAPFALIRTRNLSDLNDVPTSRNNLGLKAGAILDIATQMEITAGTSGNLVTAQTLSGFFDLATTAVNGSIRIPDRPGGIIFAWGTAAAGSGGTFTVTFNTPPFVIPQVASGQGGGSFAPDHVITNAVTTTGFTTYLQTLARKYIAIGK